MSLRKDRLSWAFIGLGLAVVGVTAYFALMPHLRPQLQLRLGDGVYDALVVHPGRSETYDLSRHELRQNQAVLRIYDTDGMWPVDVKKRMVATDIVWLDSTKKVVYIVKHASGESKPDTTFRPTEAARYIVELSDGAVENKAMRIGGTAYFDESLLGVNKS